MKTPKKQEKIVKIIQVFSDEINGMNGRHIFGFGDDSKIYFYSKQKWIKI